MEQPVALRLRRFRYQRGLTQCQVGAWLGIPFQRIQTYEHDRDRISGSVLYRFVVTPIVPFPALEVGFDDRSPLPTAVDREAETPSLSIRRISDLAVRTAMESLIEALIYRR
jgi:transcriptional regulator with XRE-family HTH domain